VALTDDSFQPKDDGYRAVRGGATRFLELACGDCGTLVMIYQKDGPGPLWRCYLDRIFAPPELAGLQHQVQHRREMADLTCPGCGKVLGVPDVYEPENRLAYRLRRGQVKKTVRGK
jgi:ribosomal protein S27E